MLFAEELGLVMEADSTNVEEIIKAYSAQDVICHQIGWSLSTDPNVLYLNSDKNQQYNCPININQALRIVT